MKNGWICLTLLLGLGSGLSAQYIVCPPTALPSGGIPNQFPFNVYTDWRFQCIVPATMLVNTPVRFTDIEFASFQTMFFTASQFQMRMGHTTFTDFSTSGTTAFDTILGPCPTIVYDGPIQWPQITYNWCPIGLQAPFAHDGVRNLVIEIRYRGRTSGGGCMRETALPRAFTHNLYSPDPYNETHWYTPIPGEYMMLVFRLKCDPQYLLLAPDTASLGTAVFVLVSAAPPGSFYQIAASLGQLPPIPLGACRVFLSMDPIFLYSVTVGAPIFNSYAGVVNAQGKAHGQFSIPRLQPLVGVGVYHGAICYTSQGVQGCTNTDGTLITP